MGLPVSPEAKPINFYDAVNKITKLSESQKKELLRIFDNRTSAEQQQETNAYILNLSINEVDLFLHSIYQTFVNEIQQNLEQQYFGEDPYSSPYVEPVEEKDPYSGLFEGEPYFNPPGLELPQLTYTPSFQIPSYIIRELSGLPPQNYQLTPYEEYEPLPESVQPSFLLPSAPPQQFNNELDVAMAGAIQQNAGAQPFSASNPQVLSAQAVDDIERKEAESRIKQERVMAQMQAEQRARTLLERTRIELQEQAREREENAKLRAEEEKRQKQLELHAAKITKLATVAIEDKGLITDLLKAFTPAFFKGTTDLTPKFITNIERALATAGDEMQSMINATADLPADITGLKKFLEHFMKAYFLNRIMKTKTFEATHPNLFKSYTIYTKDGNSSLDLYYNVLKSRLNFSAPGLLKQIFGILESTFKGKVPKPRKLYEAYEVAMQAYDEMAYKKYKKIKPYEFSYG
jgi:hypothetical protein